VSGIVQTSAPAGEPITLAQAKAWLRVDGSEEDVLIFELIEAARIYAEKVTRRALVTQSFEQSFDAFPTSVRFQRDRFPSATLERHGGLVIGCGREIILPRSPLVSVASVKYYDEDGTLQTLSTDDYFVDTRTQPGRIVLNEDADWPDTQVRPNAVVIAFTAGFGTPSQIPMPVRVAIRQMITHWHSTARGTTAIGNIVNEVPHTADELLQTERIPEAV
jgi:hypothetical protein